MISSTSLLTAMKFLFCHRRLLLVLASLILLAIFYFGSGARPRVLAVNEVPVAFWSWRNKAPTNVEVERAFAATNANILFLRAGQLDLWNGKALRIKPASGKVPSIGKICFVYNATRNFLRGFERLDADEVAQTITETYASDLTHGFADRARIEGIQLDLDVPTRLLPRYAELLARLRQKLPLGTELSITGLPTWAGSGEINNVLSKVDFWIPQCYGAIIPAHIDQLIPISSPADVAATVARVRHLNKPFYAGLSAYGYAILYDKRGALLELRGDIDPGEATQRSELELVDRRAYVGDSSAGETRYVYRAKQALVLDDLVVNEGEQLVLDIPSVASLRESARAVRENAGNSLKGICLFRLPTDDDSSSMSVGEIGSAVQDRPTVVHTELSIKRLDAKQLEFTATNSGTVRSILDPSAVSVELLVPPGTVLGPANVSGFSSFEALCSTGTGTPEPCSPKRANVIRLNVSSWKPGDTSNATLLTNGVLFDSIPTHVTTHVDDGRVIQESYELTAEKP